MIQNSVEKPVVIIVINNIKNSLNTFILMFHYTSFNDDVCDYVDTCLLSVHLWTNISVQYSHCNLIWQAYRSSL
jgi:hypothetical protein